MNLKMHSTIAIGLMAGAFSAGASDVSALPLVNKTIAAPAQSSATLDKIWYRCGYYRCGYRRYGYYRPYYRPYYRYGYYRPRYYRPYIGVGIGGFGVRLF